MLSILEKRWPGLKDVVHLLGINFYLIFYCTNKNVVEKIEQNVAEMYVKGLTEIDAKSSLYRQSKLMLERQESVISHNPELFKKEDGVWRPILLTLGLLYKVQKVCDDYWYDAEEHFCSDSEKISTIINGLAKYWWYQMKVSRFIRGDIDDLEELKESLAKKLEKPVEDIFFVYHKDSEMSEKGLLTEHIPDISIVVDHGAKEVLLSVCGTKVKIKFIFNMTS